jgi:hypothetical protein
MYKMGSHDPFGFLKHKLWPKERSRVKLPIWLPTIKSHESPRFPCVQVACHISLKIFRQGLQFCFRTSLQSEVCTQSYGPPKSWESQVWEFRDSHLEVLRQNDIWVLVSWLGTEYTIRGKVLASPKSESWWVLWIRVYPWLISKPKVLQLCTNQLVVWFVQVCRSNWLACHSS